MSPSDDSTRPISVAELLARNGTIGAPPMGGRRRRRRGNSQAVTVAELTGEIPVIRDEEIPVVVEAEEEAEEEALADVVEDVPVTGPTHRSRAVSRRSAGQADPHRPRASPAYCLHL